MPAKWQRFSIEIPEEYGPSERELIADEVIHFIQERTKKGLNKNNKQMPGYTKDYIDSVEFKAAGKSAGKVDLTLTGDMLGALSLLSHKKGKIMIGFENGTFENAKADGNIRGTYGGSKPTRKKRDFLGITQADLALILDKYEPDSQVTKQESDIAQLAAAGADSMTGGENG